MGILNLEMYIEDTKIKKYSRRRKNRYKLKFIILFVLISVFLLIFLYRKQNINFKFDKYFFEFCEDDVAINELEPYAKNIAICENNETKAEIQAGSCILASNNNKEVIYCQNPFKRMYPASTTKLMTALIALKYADLDDKVTVGNEVLINEVGSSMANIKPKDTLTIKQLLYGLLLPSGNDAANAIAIHISGSIEKFADLMNDEAKKIYASDTNFKNANGLTDSEHYTSAYDLYLIMHECLKYDIFREITTTVAYEPTYFLADGSKFINHWDNSNQYLLGKAKLLDNLEIIGAKTGTTKAAGSCLVLGTRNKGNKDEYISIILKAENKISLYQNMNKLLDKVDK